MLIDLFIVGCLLASVEAQNAFDIPNPELPDFDPRNDVEQYSIHNFEWNLDLENQYDLSLDGTAILDSDGMGSLWIVAFDENWAELLNPVCDSSHGGTWAWNVSLSDALLESSNYQFAYHILPPVYTSSTKYTKTTTEVPSRAFRITRKSDGYAGAAPVESAPPAAASSTGSDEEAPSASPTGTYSEPTSNSQGGNNNGNTGGGGGGGLSTEAKIGIGVGIPSVIIAAITLCAMLARRR